MDNKIHNAQDSVFDNKMELSGKKKLEQLKEIGDKLKKDKKFLTVSGIKKVPGHNV